MSERKAAPRTVLELLRITTSYLAGRGVTSPRLDAEVLLAHVLGMDRVGLYVNFDRPLERDEVDHYREVVARRGGRDPVAYIVGEKEFMGKLFSVSTAVLIPRPETELLVEAVVEELSKCEVPSPLRLLDVGTGSGVIAITLAMLLPAAEVVAVDVSADALAVAARNAERHGVQHRVRFTQSDLFAGLASPLTFHCIVSNPPYIPEGGLGSLAPEVRKEPRVALCGGQDGLDMIRRLVAGSPARLVPAGLLALEVGAGQGPALREIAAGQGYVRVEIRPDYAGHDRLALLYTGDTQEALR